MEDCCVVCAEPLEWVAYGHCGHRDACSKCVTRLRFVLDDKRCVICQQALPQVFVTKFLGSFTKIIPGAELANLGTPASQIRAQHLRSVDAFFDEKAHFEEIRQLCSYTHPKLAEIEPANGEEIPQHFKSMGQLKKAVQQHLHLQFCNICLEGRKVFISEQLLYSGKDLVRHQRTGDVEGVMAESGFKGHPSCRFCNKHFFGENELFFHMQQAHEQCHICKKQQPDRFVYYRDYNELEEHFRREHYLCGDAHCLEQKFVVFASEQDLKQHNAREHAGTMTRAERRQAMTIPIDIQYQRREIEQANQRGRARGNVRLREPDPHHLATALQESMESAQRERVSSNQAASSRQTPRLDESEFPSMAGDGVSSAIGPGYSLFAQARGQAPRPEDFPALPTLSKSQKKKEKAKAKEEAETRSLAQRFQQQSQVRVLNAGQPPGNPLGAAAFPALGGSSTAGPSASLAVRSRGASPKPNWNQNPSSSDSLKQGLDAFPALPQAPKRPPSQPPAFPPQTLRPAGRPGVAAQGSTSGRPGASLKLNDFPALGGGASSTNANGNYSAKGSAGNLRKQASETSSSQSDSSEDAPPSKPERGMSEALKAANKVLLEKVKKQLSASKFGEFRQSVGSFMRGEIGARQYHAVVSSLGLSHLIPEMASLLTDPVKRTELLSVHETSASTSKMYVPPEAAAAALKAAKSHGSWECTACTLINEPRAATCEACGSKRPLQSLGTLTRTKSSSTDKPSDPQTATANGQKSGPKKMPKFERLRVTSGGQDSAFQEEVERRTKPQNAWTHKHTLTGRLEDPLKNANAALWPQKSNHNAWGSK